MKYILKYKINAKEFKAVFKNHKRKHEVAILIELMNLIEPLTDLVEWNNQRKIRKKEYSWIDRFILNAIDTLRIIKPVVEMGMNIKWWDSADEIKQKGLYVDFVGKLFTPADFVRTDYDQAKPAVERIKRNFRLINIAFNRLPQQDINNLIYILNEGTKRKTIRKDKET